MTSIRTAKLTYESWLALPETKQRYEIVDGVTDGPGSNLVSPMDNCAAGNAARAIRE